MWIGISIILIGFFLVMIGVIFWIISMLKRGVKQKEEIKAAGVFFIGPIPIVIASDKEMAKIALYFTLIGIIFFIIVLILSIY